MAVTTFCRAWCHESGDIRTFSLDAISACVELETKARTVAESTLVAYYDTGYGIFGGAKQHWAKLKFNATAARYVDGEVWHAEQRCRYDKAGNYHLEVPYALSRELVMDILRHGPDVEVLGPASLRKEVKGRVEALQAIYRS